MQVIKFILSDKEFIDGHLSDPFAILVNVFDISRLGYDVIENENAFIDVAAEYMHHKLPVKNEIRFSKGSIEVVLQSIDLLLISMMKVDFDNLDYKIEIYRGN
ncbi:hypothetical protein GCM10007420_27290 [Glycocaulis albus]|uniref:Uncharacterized protein n=1 Tax=Glycocaulis albus TaxID=1382801 RepID=A0ABQ1Y1A3_9PROT|nr:hypothetical protein [Glycocaulis albus]GGH09033.1 hypothetical protein GCM10007420_27290 [Glycocaulis albus]